MKPLGRWLICWMMLFATVAGAESELERLRTRQQADLQHLRDYYDTQARKQVPRNPDGSLDTSSDTYRKLLNDYKRAHQRVQDVYHKKDPRLADFEAGKSMEGLKSSGSAPRNVNSDVDWTAETDEAFQKKRAEWEARGDKLEVEGHKVVNKTTDETLWEPGTKAGSDGLVGDGDAHGTQGGREEVTRSKGREGFDKSGDGIRDAEGSALDHEKKYLDAKKRGNLKDQSKVVSKSSSNPDSEVVKKAKNIKDYGDEITSGVSDLGDDPETRTRKVEEFQQKLDAEMEQNVREGTKKGQQTDELRRKIADSAKKAETSGDSKWDEARKKANYGDQDSTSEALEKRRQEVAESNRKTKEEIQRRKSELEAETGKKSAGAPEGEAPSAKKKAPPELETASGKKVATIEAESPKVKVDAPDVPKVKVDAPDAPKIKVDAPDFKTKVIKTVGDGLDGVDIFSTAEDVKEDFKKGEFTEGAKKVGEAVADEVTMGAYSGAKTMKDKKEDVDQADSELAQTNASLREQHDQNLRVELRKAGMSKEDVNNIKTTDGLEHALKKRGVDVPKAPEEISYVDKGDKGVEQLKRQISEEHKGNMRDELVESGAMTQEEADQIRTEAGLEHALNKQGLKVPEKRESGFVEVDDTWDERTEQVGEGIKTNVKKAGKFLENAASDTTEIGAGLTEKGVAKQAFENSKENAKGWLETWEEERKSEKFTGDSKEDMIEYLKKRGASPVGAKKAADDLYEKGDIRGVENLDDTLRYKDAVREAKRRGEAVPSKEEFDKVSNSLKAKKERARAAKEEESASNEDDDAQEFERSIADDKGQKADGLKKEEAGNGGEWSEEDDVEEKRSALEDFAQRNQERRENKTEKEFDGMEIRSEMAEAENAGNDDRRQARSERNQAGEDARDIESETNRIVSEGDKENSWGKQIGDAIEDGFTTGAKTLGQEFGNAAAEKVIDEMWEPDPPPSSAASKGSSAGARPSGGGGGSSGSPVPASGMVSSGGSTPAGNVVDSSIPDGSLPQSGGGTGGEGAVPEVSAGGEGLAETGEGEEDDDWGLEDIIKGAADKAADKQKKALDDWMDRTEKAATKPTQANTAVPVGETRATPTSEYPPGMKPCIRCGAVKKIPKQESLCMSCVTKVMLSYANYVQTGSGRGDEGYFHYLSSGTKAQIERNNSQ